MQSSCHDGMGTWFGSPPQLLEPCRVGGGVLDGVLNIPVSEVILSEPRVCALVGQGEAASMAQHVGMNEQGQGSCGAVFSQEQVNGRAVQRLALLAYKERLAGRLIRARSFNQALIALSS